MLVIAHYTHSDGASRRTIRNALNTTENSADIVLVNIRLTKDNSLIVADAPFLDGKKEGPRVRTSTLKELRRYTAGSSHPIVSLSEVLKRLFGTCMLFFEVHEKAAAEPLLASLGPFIHSNDDWSTILIGSESPLLLRKIRRQAPLAQLSLTHPRHAPLLFVAWHPVIRLSAVVIHRLSASSLVIEAAHRLDILVCAYTVDRPKTAKRLETIGVDAVVTNHPEKFA